jgi:hypothetical protein
LLGSTVADDVAAETMGRGEDAVVANEIGGGRWHSSDELFDELMRCEDDDAGAVAPGLAEPKLDYDYDYVGAG